MEGGSAQGLNLDVWSLTVCRVLFGDSERVPDLVGLYFGGERQRRDIHNKEVKCPKLYPESESGQFHRKKEVKEVQEIGMK